MPHRAATEGSAADLAHRAIRAAIIDGTHAAGTMLSENELAAALGVSRTPIRSALTRLQDEGWITIYPRRGALVLGLTPAEVRDLADARVVLESSGVQRAPAEARRRLARELRDSIAMQRRALRRGAVADFVELSVQFHRAFVDVGANSFLIELSERLGDRQRQLLFAQRHTLPERVEQVVGEHEELLRLLADDDPAAFAGVLREHLTGTLGYHLGSL
jgi:DNA-binding GntR family transcriptional regulator